MKLGTYAFVGMLSWGIITPLNAGAAQPEIRSIRTTTVWTHTPAVGAPCGTVTFTSRGITNFWVNLYPWRMPIDESDPPFDRTRLDLLLQIDEPVRQWSVPVTATESFTTITNAVPAPLSVGAYVLAVSTVPTFSLGKSTRGALYAGVVQVSDLAAETLTFPAQNRVRVTAAATGAPVADVQIMALTRDNRHPQRTRAAGHTDAAGCLAVPRHTDRLCDTWILMKEADILVDPLGWREGATTPPPPEPKHTLLFTDRDSYFPGELIHYKGIFYTADPATGTYAVRTEATYTIRLLDPEDKTLALEKQYANDFGSFAGVFTVPTNCPGGRLTLIMGDAAASATHLTVIAPAAARTPAAAAATASTNAPAAPSTNRIAAAALPTPAPVATATRQPTRPATAAEEVPPPEPEPTEAPAFLQFDQERVAVGETFKATWLSDDSRAYGRLEIWSDGRLMEHEGAAPGTPSTTLAFPVTARFRGGFTLRGTYSLPDRTYSQIYRIEVPWDSQRLTLAWTAATVAPKPGERTSHVLTIQKPAGAEASPTEVLAVLYDASRTGGKRPDGWTGFACFREEATAFREHFSSEPFALEAFRELRQLETPAQATTAATPALLPSLPTATTNAAPLAARQTTVFLPQLISDAEGRVEITFPQPPADGDWRLWVFAHDASLRSAQSEKSIRP